MCPNIVQKYATSVTGEVHPNHHLQDATEMYKNGANWKMFCFYKLQTYMGKQYLTEQAIFLGKKFWLILELPMDRVLYAFKVLTSTLWSRFISSLTYIALLNTQSRSTAVNCLCASSQAGTQKKC